MDKRTQYINRFARVMRVDSSWIRELPPQGLAAFHLVMAALKAMPPDQRKEKYDELLRGMATSFVDKAAEHGWTDEQFDIAITVMERGAGM